MRLMLFCVMILMTFGCARVDLHSTGKVQHVLLCRLKSPGDEAAIRQLVEESQNFLKIEGIEAVWAGTPLTPLRPQARADYDIGLVMLFTDQAAYEAYLKHPQHKAAIERSLKPLVASFEVIDIACR